VVAFASRIHAIGGRVDSSLVAQIQEETRYWRSVLKRIIASVKFLASRGLAFRGENETFGSQHNGNFLGALEFLAEFDDFLSAHIQKHGNRGSGHTSYLSSTTCNEIIDLVAQKVLETILLELHQAKYYSITVDSTPDVMCHMLIN